MFKKFLTILLSTALCLSTFSLVGCNKNELSVFNCYDYIDEDLIDAFEDYYKEQTGEKITVKYSCFDTPEDAYKKLKIGKGGYDLVCPSDYMIEKMAREGMLQKFTMSDSGNYNTYVSPYIKNVFSSISWTNNDGETESLSDYAVGYMWGTLGLVYNTEKVAEEDMASWGSLWTNKYKSKFSIKDSVRDTYFIGLAKRFESELATAKSTYQSQKDLIAYQTALKGYFNNVEPSTVSSVKDVLITLAKNSHNLEVDEGKTDIIDGIIDINFAWSGDAVYALDEADSQGVSLNYRVPDEGSNVWFDGWVIPKTSTKVDAAKMFLEFISKPENVVKNMEYIGYTSVIGGDEVFDYAVENYDESEGTISCDLSYFFGEGDYVIKTSQAFGGLYTQYPPKDVIDRCVVMSYFEDTANENINTMWVAVKSNISKK